MSSSDKTAARPAHHTADGKFCNPWPSYQHGHAIDYAFKVLPFWRKQTLHALPVQKPCFPTAANGYKTSATDSTTAATSTFSASTSPLHATWIGHATFLVTMYGWNILTDPVFSDRCSPVSFAGPKRFTLPACTIADLPVIHVVTVSHNHYDHLDATSVAQLLAKEKADKAAARAAGQEYAGIKWVCALKVSQNLISMGVPLEAIQEVDWWQSAELSRETLGDGSTAKLSLVGVPAQHHSQRSVFDRYCTLWCGFLLVAEVDRSSTLATTVGGAGAVAPPADNRISVFFSGDTGYRTVPADAEPGSEAERSAPTCPAFRELGERYGPIDLSLIPIGAYSPRWFMCGHHLSPEDAVDVHIDVRSRQSIGMHWGTFPMTDEPILEPPERLRTAMAARHLDDRSFIALQHGATWSMPARATQADPAPAPTPAAS